MADRPKLRTRDEAQNWLACLQAAQSYCLVSSESAAKHADELYGELQSRLDEANDECAVCKDMGIYIDDGPMYCGCAAGVSVMRYEVGMGDEEIAGRVAEWKRERSVKP